MVITSVMTMSGTLAAERRNALENWPTCTFSISSHLAWFLTQPCPFAQRRIEPPARRTNPGQRHTTKSPTSSSV